MDQDRGTFGPYLKGHMDRKGWNITQLGLEAGVSQAIISRWISGQTTPSVENLRPVAHAIGRPLLEVVVAAGILTPEEAKAKVVHSPAGTLSDEQLLAEVERRIKTGARPAPTLEKVAEQPGRFEVVGAKKPARRKKGEGGRS
ncbi:hypothetical protein Lesp02_70220 [Lentzea sp. NBRC 105346]|uniref:helix-turn-helix domain-containing protein n=1 Tax=Lentzea sp. NBRC 105346 TaxID=3032205 RepID=UPI0024A4516E|nr:helix-turn-helix transcriptional regulator [Lentzea sp. NBRC 105346]GLZ34835.1 hypothetical protein Lesp02_70220 [Lentzea sp. NBRC 105346]